jgi:hypothetical protein
MISFIHRLLNSWRIFPLYPSERKLGGYQSLFGRSDEKKSDCSYGNRNPFSGSSTRSPVTTLTDHASCLQNNISKNNKSSVRRKKSLMFSRIIKFDSNTKW